jgi:hypothetical protein
MCCPARVYPCRHTPRRRKPPTTRPLAASACRCDAWHAVHLSLLHEPDFFAALQVLKCFDHKHRVLRAVKIIRNKSRFHHQAQMELKVLHHLLRKVRARECSSGTLCCAYGICAVLCGGVQRRLRAAAVARALQRCERRVCMCAWPGVKSRGLCTAPMLHLMHPCNYHRDSCCQDPEGQYNVIHIVDSFEFRQHLCISFELMSHSLYDFMRLHDFQERRRDLAVCCLACARARTDTDTLRFELQHAELALRCTVHQGIVVSYAMARCEQPVQQRNEA